MQARPPTPYLSTGSPKLRSAYLLYPASTPCSITLVISKPDTLELYRTPIPHSSKTPDNATPPRL